MMGGAAARVQYSPTITFGNLVTVVTLIITGTAIFAKIDARVWVLEETDRRRDVELKELKTELKETRIDLKEGFSKVNENLKQMEIRQVKGKPG